MSHHPHRRIHRGQGGPGAIRRAVEKAASTNPVRSAGAAASIGVVLALTAAAICPPALAGTDASAPGPDSHRIIDMHLHALPVTFFGPGPMAACSGSTEFYAPDPSKISRVEQVEQCPEPLRSAATDDTLRRRTLELLERYDVIGVTSGPPEYVDRWREAAPDRIIPGLLLGADSHSIAELRRRIEDGKLEVIGEVTSQYQGIAPDDPAMEPIFALAEELDVPVSLHMGPGPPGTPYVTGGSAAYRARLSNPLLLEEVLVRHPRLRVSVAHAGWPMLDEMIHLMWTHPQVYVDVGVIDWALPRAEFYHYLRRLVEAGFGKRVMFGSDQMLWPEALEIAIASIEDAPFLDEQQRRDILYRNAARFLHLPGTTSGS